MSYTFGAATSDDITGTAAQAANNSGGAFLVTGWWYPTTLTAGRAYWSCGNVTDMQVNTTTSELRLILDRATTDCELTTSGAGITTNKWWFISAMVSPLNAATAVARVWVGDENTQPTMITPTAAVAGSGNYTSSTNRTVGNRGTGTVAFQGDIGWVHWLAIQASDIAAPLYNATGGTITAGEATLVEERWVLPLWRGTPDPSLISLVAPVPFSMFHWDGCAAPGSAGGNPASQWSQSTTPGGVAMTVSGATYSQNEPPIRLSPDWIYGPRRRL